MQSMGNKRELSGKESSLTLVGSAGQAAQHPGIHGGRGGQLQARGCRVGTALLPLLCLSSLLPAAPTQAPLLSDLL